MVKGGTSLSKGFGLIERFSEDLDLRVDPGTVEGLVEPVLPWNDGNKKRVKRGVAERTAWLDALASALRVPGCRVQRNPEGSDPRMRSAWLEVGYPILHAAELPASMRPFVLLEVGRARVVPAVERDLSSWVHDHLATTGVAADYVDNRPRGLRCVHPLVTGIEKLSAIARRFDAGKGAADFVRHYEDASRIIAARPSLPPLNVALPELVRMLADEDGTMLPQPLHGAFMPHGTDRWREIEAAWAAIGPMFWGPRETLDASTRVLRAFLEEVISGLAPW